MSLPLSELMQFERWLEDGFKDILIAVAPNTFTSRDNGTSATPRLTITATIGELASAHVHPTTNGNSVYDAFEGEVEVEVETNRVTEAKSNAHYEAIGCTRAAMIDYLARSKWSTTNPLRIDDIRPVSAEHTVDLEDNLDSTKLKFYICFNVNPSQWPAI